MRTHLGRPTGQQGNRQVYRRERHIGRHEGRHMRGGGRERERSKGMRKAGKVPDTENSKMALIFKSLFLHILSCGS
jgi:hypothetical protein